MASRMTYFFSRCAACGQQCREEAFLVPVLDGKELEPRRRLAAPVCSKTCWFTLTQQRKPLAYKIQPWLVLARAEFPPMRRSLSGEWHWAVVPTADDAKLLTGQLKRAGIKFIAKPTKIRSPAKLPPAPLRDDHALIIQRAKAAARAQRITAKKSQLTSEPALL
jgi:hypothetical protein